MDPTLQLLSEWIAGAGVVLGVLKVAKARVYAPSMLFVEEVRTALDQVKGMHTELGPNGGKSLKDTVNRIDQRTRMTDARQAALIAAQPEPMFEADLEGCFTAANRALEELTGYSRAHLLGNEWVNALHPEDKATVLKNWIGDEGAVPQQRPFYQHCRLLTKTARILLVRIEAYPMREGPNSLRLERRDTPRDSAIADPPIVGWLGMVIVEQRA